MQPSKSAAAPPPQENSQHHLSFSFPGLPMQSPYQLKARNLTSNWFSKQQLPIANPREALQVKSKGLHIKGQKDPDFQKQLILERCFLPVMYQFKKPRAYKILAILPKVIWTGLVTLRKWSIRYYRPQFSIPSHRRKDGSNRSKQG